MKMYIIVAGGGMVGGDCAKRLVENKHDVVTIDRDVEICNKIYASTGVVAIHGNCTSIDILKEAGAEKADVLVAATPNDADNLATAVLAKSLGVKQVIVRMRDPNYENAYRVAGVDSLVRMTDMMINQMLLEIENPEVRRIHSIGGGKANIFMVVVPKGAKIAGQKIKDIVTRSHFPKDCIFIALYDLSKDVFSIPRGEAVITEGDELFMISPAEDIKKVMDFLTAKKSTNGN